MACSVQRHGGSGSGGVVGNDIQLHHRDGTDEMSVAIDLAKLSQGHYTSNDYRHTNNSITLGTMSSQVIIDTFSDYSMIPHSAYFLLAVAQAHPNSKYRFCRGSTQVVGIQFVDENCMNMY